MLVVVVVVVVAAAAVVVVQLHGCSEVAEASVNAAGARRRHFRDVLANSDAGQAEDEVSVIGKPVTRAVLLPQVHLPGQTHLLCGDEGELVELGLGGGDAVGVGGAVRVDDPGGAVVPDAVDDTLVHRHAPHGPAVKAVRFPR